MRLWHCFVRNSCVFEVCGLLLLVNESFGKSEARAVWFLWVDLPRLFFQWYSLEEVWFGNVDHGLPCFYFGRICSYPVMEGVPNVTCYQELHNVTQQDQGKNLNTGLVYSLKFELANYWRPTRSVCKMWSTKNIFFFIKRRNSGMWSKPL